MLDIWCLISDTIDPEESPEPVEQESLEAYVARSTRELHNSTANYGEALEHEEEGNFAEIHDQEEDVQTVDDQVLNFYYGIINNTFLFE